MMKKNQKKRNSHISGLTLLLVLAGAILYVSFFFLPDFFQEEYSDVTYADQIDSAEEVAEEPEVEHLATPEQVKAIYMTACVAGTTDFRQDLVDLIEETEINSLIIDIKDFSGTISFPTDNPKLLGTGGPGCKAPGMKEFIEDLHDRGIYVIGRITVFQDPYYTALHPELAVKRKDNGEVWEDHKGISFIEVGAREYWDYIVELAKESYALGFDELNFDYIRFPSDGNMDNTYYPFSNDILVADPEFGKAKALKKFFEYLDSELEETGMVTSADLFGMTTTNTDDLNIGQVLEDALPHFDYIAPMVYPSHYPVGFLNLDDPNKYPYLVVNHSMQVAVDRINTMKNSTSTPASVREEIHPLQLRPWLQDFDYGGNYDVAEVKAQIDATYDAGLNSWMIWAPSNRYTKGAYLGE